MSKTLYTVINPVVKFILTSPLHSLMSRNTVLLEFTGRKTGKTYTTPVSYYEANGTLYCVTEKTNLWWKNLQDGHEIQVTWRGQKRSGTPSVVADGSTAVATALNELLLASPRDAAHAGVTLDRQGKPDAAEVAAASKTLVLITIEVAKDV